MPKRKGRSSASTSSRPLHLLSLDVHTTNPNPNPNPNMSEQDDAHQIQNPQTPIPIPDSLEDLKDQNVNQIVDPTPAQQQEEEAEEDQLQITDKGETFDAKEVELESLRNVTTRRGNKRRKNTTTTTAKTTTISIEEEDDDKEESLKDVIVDVKDSLEEITQIPTSPNHEIDAKGGNLEAESDHDHDHEHEEEEEEEDEDQVEQKQGMDVSSPVKVAPVDDTAVLPTASNLSKQVIKKNKNKKKKKALTAKKKAALDKKLELAKQKLELLKKNLEVIPFSPEKKLDFAKHEELFKRLGLWDFVNIEFDNYNLRPDLIALLVANYDSNSRGSEVNGCRIKVSRADLARALKLPGKKEKGIVSEGCDFDSEGLSEEAVLFIEEFVSTWILLHEDAWMLPKEVVNWTTLIKNKQPHKVDWPSLMWLMVERELKAAPDVGTLYYAAHIQCLMKSQREDLFKEEARQEDPMDDEEAGVDLKMGSPDDNQEQQIEKEQFDLCLGQSNNEDEQQHKDTDAMEYQDCTQESSDKAEWLMDDKIHKNDFSLRHCNLNDTQNLESQDAMKEEAEYDDFLKPQSKDVNLEGLASTDFLQGIGATDVTYSQSYRFPGPTSGDIFNSDTDIHLNTGGTSVLPNTCKRENSHDNFVNDHTLNGHHKRMRNDVSSSEFSLVMEQINCLTERATMMYEEKAQASARINAHQFLELQQQNDILMSDLQNAHWESHQKDKQIYKLEHELHLMTSLLEGYRKALKENERAFSEYRERNPKPEEPLYKDVGPGGLVLSTIEIERQCHVIKHMFEKFGADWCERFQGYGNDVSCLDERLVGLEESVKLLKENYANPKTEENSIKEVAQIPQFAEQHHL